MEIIIALQDVFYYVILLALITLYYMAFKSDVYSIFDPIVIFIVNLVFSSSLVIWIGVNGYIQMRYTVAFIICTAFFIIGFKTASGKFSFGKHSLSPINRSSLRKRLNTCSTMNLDLDHLFVFIVLLFFINIIALGYSFMNGSFAILSENPALDRVSLAASNRWLSVVKAACTPVGLIISCFLALYSKSLLRKYLSIFIAVSFLVNYLTAGSKGAVLSTVFVFGTLIIFIKANKLKVPYVLLRLTYFLILLGVMYFSFIASTSQMGEMKWALKLILRLVLSGESYLYFFGENQYDSLKFTYSLSTYVLHTVTSSIGWKLVPYNIGVALYGGSTGNYSGFGPNPQHVVEGMIFWGIYFAPFYSLVIGYLTSYTRRIFLGKTSNLCFVSFIVLFLNAGNLPIDITMWLFSVLSAIAILAPIYMLSKFIILFFTKINIYTSNKGILA